MKMLIKERAQINLSFSIILDLLECHFGHKRDFLHDQICNQFNCHRGIHSLSASHSHSVNLKVILKPSPELLYRMMLLPDGDSLTSSQLPSEDHETLDLRAVHKEHQYHFAKGWAFCLFPGYWYAFASPARIIKAYLLLVQGKFLLLAINGKHIVAFGMNQYLVELFSFKYLNQVVRAIPTVEGDRKLDQVNPFLMKQLQYRMEHIPENLGFGCIATALFTNRSDAQRYNPFTYPDGYGYDVLTLNRTMVSPTEPVVGKTYDLTHPVYDCIINTKGNPHSGKCCRTFGEGFGYKFLCLGKSGIQEHLSQMIYAPGVDGVVDFILVKTQSLYELIGSEYVEHMCISQHQQNLQRFLVTLGKIGVEILLKYFNDFVNLIYHFCLLMGLIAFSLNTTYKEALFFLYCQGFLSFFMYS